MRMVLVDRNKKELMNFAVEIDNERKKGNFDEKKFFQRKLKESRS